MKTCGDLETASIDRHVTTWSAAIASPDRWIAGVRAAVVRFVVWERARVRCGWLGHELTLVHGTARTTVPLAGVTLEGDAWSTSKRATPLHHLLRLSPDARLEVRALHHGDLIRLQMRAGKITRIVATESALTLATDVA